MGDLIALDDHRRTPVAAPSRGPAGRFLRTTFSFDLALPQTYLAAERVDQTFTGVRWQPAYASAVYRGPLPVDQLMAAAEGRAGALSVPLVWPEPFALEVRPAMRAAALACELGRGAAFVLAASRLAFCGGFDLGDPEVLAEAAAAACVPLEDCLAAAGDAARDIEMLATGQRLRELGAVELPTLRVGRRLFSGEERLPEAVAAATASA